MKRLIYLFTILDLKFIPYALHTVQYITRSFFAKSAWIKKVLVIYEKQKL